MKSKKSILKQVNLGIVIMILWPIIAAVISLAINANILTSIFLFLTMPGIYLSFKKPDKIKKIALFSFVSSIPLAIIIDYIMQSTGGWIIPNSIFYFKLFRFVTIEQIIWLIFYIYFVLMFYEVFLDRKCNDKVLTGRTKYWFILLFVLLGVFFYFYFINPQALLIDYFYLKLGIFAVLLPLLYLFFSFSNVYLKIIKAGVYFSFYSLIYELTALQLGQWEFPARQQFIGFVNLFGKSFPFEEMLFWIILGAIALISYYEYFDDDMK